ncbi:MAG: DNA-binding response regulator [Bacteroidetes bacterium]|nr:MAG: DNA-binding response regulator [Bacteroidota bacterium]
MEQNPYKILVIDDEPQIRRLLRVTLETYEYLMFEEATAAEGIRSIVMNRPDVVLLDLGLPDEDGFGVLKRLREWSTLPVIVLTVDNSEIMKIAALDAGADDYITKPFDTGELLARIRVAIRHAHKLDEAPIFRSGHMEVDLNARLVKVGDEEVKLTVTEYALLSLLVKNAGKVLTHSFISREIWKNPYSDNSQILRVHIAQIRKKIERDPSLPELLITEPGVGYRLRMDEGRGMSLRGTQ